jgi:hypothetical protein
VVNAYARPSVNPRAVSAVRYAGKPAMAASAPGDSAAATVVASNTAVGERFSASRPDSAPPSAAPIEGPSNAKPACSGSRLRTCCRLSVDRKIVTP